MPDAPQQRPIEAGKPVVAPSADPYRAVARSSALLAAPVGLALLVVSALLWGSGGLVGGAVGLVVVLVVLGSSPLIMSWAVRSQASRANPHFPVMVAMGSWVLKVSVLALLVLLLAGRSWLDSRGFALTAGPTAVVWLAAEMRAFARAKMPIYDAAP